MLKADNAKLVMFLVIHKLRKIISDCIDINVRNTNTTYELHPCLFFNYGHDAAVDGMR